MSFLSKEIERQLLEKDKTADSLAKQPGLSRSLIQRWMKKGQTSISEEQMYSLCAALGGTPPTQARLTLAHLRDENIGPAKHLIGIMPLENAEVPPPKTKLELAVEFLMEKATRSDKHADVLIKLAISQGAELD